MFSPAVGELEESGPPPGSSTISKAFPRRLLPASTSKRIERVDEDLRPTVSEPPRRSGARRRRRSSTDWTTRAPSALARDLRCGDGALGLEDEGPQPCARRVRRSGGCRVPRRGADHGPDAGFERPRDRDSMPRSLKLPIGLAPSHFRYSSVPSRSKARRVEQRRRALAERHDRRRLVRRGGGRGIGRRGRARSTRSYHAQPRLDDASIGDHRESRRREWIASSSAISSSAASTCPAGASWTTWSALRYRPAPGRAGRPTRRACKPLGDVGEHAGSVVDVQVEVERRAQSPDRGARASRQHGSLWRKPVPVVPIIETRSATTAGSGLDPSRTGPFERDLTDSVALEHDALERPSTAASGWWRSTSAGRTRTSTLSSMSVAADEPHGHLDFPGCGAPVAGDRLQASYSTSSRVTLEPNDRGEDGHLGGCVGSRDVLEGSASAKPCR